MYRNRQGTRQIKKTPKHAVGTMAILLCELTLTKTRQLPESPTWGSVPPHLPSQQPNNGPQNRDAHVITIQLVTLNDYMTGRLFCRQRDGRDERSDERERKEMAEVRLLSSDDVEFRVPRDVAEKSVVIKNMLEGSTINGGFGPRLAHV